MQKYNTIQSFFTMEITMKIKVRNKYKSFRLFLDEATVNEKHVYHVGYLPIDKKNNDILTKTNDKIWEAYHRGLIDLMQRKLDEFQYEYIAVRTFHIGPRVFKGCYVEKT